MFSGERPWDVTGGMLVPEGYSPEQREAFLAWQRRIASHVAVQVLDPQTLSYGLHDSPSGLLAWLVERRRAWGCCNGDLESRFDRDFLLTTAMIYWGNSKLCEFGALLRGSCSQSMAAIARGNADDPGSCRLEQHAG